MPDKKMWVHWEDGADLSQSRKKPGDYSPLTRDDDNNLSHVTLSDVDDDDDDYDWQADSEEEDDDDQRAAELEAEAVLVALLALVVVAVAAPHVKRWWNDQAVPLLKKSRKRFSRDRTVRDEEFVEISVDEHFTLPQTPPTQSSQEMVAALDEYRASMSSSEARERFVAAVVARAFSEEQLRLLRHARIEDDGSALDLASAIETLTPQQLGESITLMLEANPSWPDDQQLAELERVLERRGRGDSEFVPVERRRIETLRLPRVEE